MALRTFARLRSYWKAAKFIGISSSTLHRWVAQGPPALRYKTRHKPCIDSAVAQAVSRELAACATTTLKHIRVSLLAKGISRCTKTISRVVKSLGFTRKRTTRRSAPANTPEAAAQYAARVQCYCELVAAAAHKGTLLVSVDECYFSERTLPLYGYSPRGRKCVVTSTTGSWKQRTLLSAVASDGSSHHMVIRGAANKQVFFRFITQLPYPPGTMILLDNVAFHKNLSPFVAKAFTPAFTPPYSPWFNPVESCFSVIKGAFRADFPWPLGVDSAISEQASALSAVTCTGVFRALHELVRESLLGGGANAHASHASHASHA